ncbi:hypothetical protein BDN72DRAFT_339602 [Pluteus cervinus]|uniref:Uncharacterized protein n=1 Tax=Pluteus cervinus TaxID=181527 RepID=A0ACD3ABJ7_9AGAR|nr:hypothetical protein BDN72DRAFT_339602 [Pluteus cervinus]
MDSSPPCVSFIGIVDFSQEARWIYMTDSVADLLGYEPHELLGRPSLELVHPDEFPRVKQMHYDTIQQDKAAVLAYLRMRHKDPYKGYILCGISRTVVHNVLVGSVSFASPGAKALHNASTAQEIEVVTPSALNFQFRRWNDPSPMPPSPPLRSRPLPSSPSSRSSSEERSPSPEHRQEPITFDHLPNKSFRTAFILDRFSVNCTISYCSNDLLLSTTSAIGRSFFDFVAKKDEDIVRSWIDVIKSWGVNERGQPSDGGFGFGRFGLLIDGRDSIGRVPEPPPSRHRHGSSASGGHTSKSRASKSRPAPTSRSRPPTHSPVTDSNSPQISVDAIFSAHSDGLMVILRRAPLPS